jgi:hypothetical protein
VAPPECACCGAPATERAAIGDRAGRELLVGYCRPCADHVAREQTRKLAAVLSSALLGVALAAGLPMIAPFLPLVACASLTLAASALPLAPLWWARHPSPGHARRGAAVRFDGESSLLCFDRAYANALAKSAGSQPTDAPTDRASPRELALPLVCALALAPAFYLREHPPLRTINANAESFELFVDGRSFGRVEPSSTESPGAGMATRIPAGTRVLRATGTSGRTIAEARVDVLSGRDHLFAPGAPETCFWLERAAYGRAEGGFERVPLEGESRFWAIPDGVLGWFVPSPPPEEGARTTGGTTTVLRQGPCDEMPLER